MTNLANQVETAIIWIELENIHKSLFNKCESSQVGYYNKGNNKSSVSDLFCNKVTGCLRLNKHWICLWLYNRFNSKHSSYAVILSKHVKMTAVKSLPSFCTFLKPPRFRHWADTRPAQQYCILFTDTNHPFASIQNRKTK